MKRLTLATLASTLFLPLPVLAQTAPPASPPALPMPAPELPRLNTNPQSGDLLGEIYRQTLDSRARLAVQNTSPARLRRAERVAALINAGDCAGAEALAVQERDRRLAGRVAEVCASDN